MNESPTQPQTTPCPTCRQPVSSDIKTYPFCSKRCRLVDLGKWLNGRYVISRPIEEGDLDEADQQQHDPRRSEPGA